MSFALPLQQNNLNKIQAKSVRELTVDQKWKSREEDVVPPKLNVSLLNTVFESTNLFMQFSNFSTKDPNSSNVRVGESASLQVRKTLSQLKRERW